MKNNEDNKKCVELSLKEKIIDTGITIIIWIILWTPVEFFITGSNTINIYLYVGAIVGYSLNLSLTQCKKE